MMFIVKLVEEHDHIKTVTTRRYEDKREAEATFLNLKESIMERITSTETGVKLKLVDEKTGEVLLKWKKKKYHF